MKQWLCVAVMAGLALAPGAAAAHAFLKTSMPAVGSTVPRAPVAVVIEFTEGVEPSFSEITVQDASGAEVQDGRARLESGNTRLAVPLKPLPPGVYTVSWHVTAVDTHKTEGRFTFTVEH